ncbi:hypothetical protein RIF29_16335 [Crotalaria pallida]|uniref:Uncharacterized protein n=1 Tax=Crotalaria pallida TaxID=3830 RepID=A0AAN9FH37_CROPI
MNYSLRFISIYKHGWLHYNNGACLLSTEINHFFLSFSLTHSPSEVAKANTSSPHSTSLSVSLFALIHLP